MMAALATGLSPEHPREFDLGKASAVFVAIAIWLFAEIGSGKVASQADVALLRRIKDVVNEHALSFLLIQDFGASFTDRQISPIGEICSWHGVDIEFVDQKIEQAWKLTLAEFNSLNRLYAQHLGPAYRVDRLCAVPPGTDEWNMPKHLIEAVDALNSQASKAYKAFNDFDRTARIRLNL